MKNGNTIIVPHFNYGISQAFLHSHCHSRISCPSLCQCLSLCPPGCIYYITRHTIYLLTTWPRILSRCRCRCRCFGRCGPRHSNTSNRTFVFATGESGLPIAPCNPLLRSPVSPFLLRLRLRLWLSHRLSCRHVIATILWSTIYVLSICIKLILPKRKLRRQMARIALEKIILKCKI